MSDRQREHREVETISDSRWIRLLMWVGFPVVGVLLALGLKALAKVVLGLKWVPFQGPLELISSIPEPGATIGAVVVGVVAGLVLAAVGRRESVSVDVSADRVLINRGGEPVREVPGDRIAAGLTDGKQLVLLGHDTAELARESTDLDRSALAAAMRRHGYVWHDSDPYRDEFTRWVPGTSDLPQSANALLRARAQAVTKDDSAADAADLRDQLADQGVVVRDTKKQQYWRLVRSRDQEAHPGTDR